MNATVFPPAAPATGADAALVSTSVPVLLVDDNPAKRLALKAILLPLGYSLVEADSCLAALRCLMVQDFAVILLDVRMPVTNGFETAALIRQRLQSEMTPIIFITAHDSAEIGHGDLYAEGAVDFIFAPVPPHELRAKVSAFAKLFTRAEQLARRARELQASADQLRLLLDSAPTGIFQTDAENRYIHTNPGWTEISGISAQEAEGQDWATLIASEERDGLVLTLPDDRAGGAERWERFEIRSVGSPPRTVVVISTPIIDGSGEVSGFVGTLADISAETSAEAVMSRARDKATEASQLKSDFLANMSHEIRTPMNGVIGMTELLLETDLDACQRDYAQTVRNSGEALLTIIDDILDVSKIEAGKLEIEEIEFEPEALVNDVMRLLAGPAQSKGLDLIVVVDPSVPTLVRGDPGRVRQVVTNLIGNAVKFTHTGEIVVRVTCAELANDESLVRFEVADTGDGIAADKLALIFEPFVQANTSTSRRYGGTGLGLAISSQLVGLMGGTCGVSSRLGEGSVFWFTVSLHAVRAQTGDQGRPPAFASADVSAHLPEPVPGEGPGASVRVGRGPQPTDATPAPRPHPSDGETDQVWLLHAEDNPINQKVVLAMLSGEGYRIDTVPNGAVAVRAAAARFYDTILMDCQMPELDGYQATAAIRAQEDENRRTPIIALTAAAGSGERERCLAAGMDDYLAKPLSKHALRTLVAGSISNAAARPTTAATDGRTANGITTDRAAAEIVEHESEPETGARGGSLPEFIISQTPRP